MAPIPPSAFERRVADLAPAARARFVADLYAARGATTRVDGDRIVVREGGDDGRTEEEGQPGDAGERTLWIARTGLLGRPRTVPDGVDAVVTAGLSRPPDLPEGVETIDAESLRTAALYGIDRADAADLLASHLDCSPTGYDPGPEHRPETDRDAGGTTGTDPSSVRVTPGGRQVPVPDEVSDPGRRGVAAVAVLGLVVALVVAPASPFAVAMGGSGSPAGSTAGADGSVDGTADGDVGEVGATGGGPVADGAADASDAEGRPDAIAPGVTVDGVERSSLLAAAHASQVRNRSYVLRVAAREEVGRLQTAYRGGEVRMDEPSAPASYRADVTEWGEFRAEPGPVPTESVYAEGSVELVRRDDGPPDVRRVGSADAAGDEYAASITTLVYWYLSVENTSVRDEWTNDGTTYYEIAGSGYSFPSVDNASTRAVIDGDGVVHALEHYHDAPGANRRVFVSFRYEFREPRIVRPEWVNESTPAPDSILPVRYAANTSGSVRIDRSWNGSASETPTDGPAVDPATGNASPP